MGKIRTRVLGSEEEEQKQKQEQKARSEAKKVEKKRSKGAIEAIKDAEKREMSEEQLEANDKKEAKKEVKKQPKEEKKEVVVHVRGKKYQQAKKQLDQKKVYSVEEAVALLKKVKFAGFDESVELHLNVDAEGLKGEVELPHSTGKTIRVRIVDDKLLDELENGKIDFDILITHPSYMPKLAKFAKVLGPKGLMPNPKAGTISPTPEAVAKKFEKGTLRWKTEPKSPLIHQMIGKSSHDDKALSENAVKFMQTVGKIHIKAAFIKTTMSPSLKINIENI